MQTVQIRCCTDNLHCLSLVEQVLDSLIGSKMDLFKFYDKVGKENASEYFG